MPTLLHISDLHRTSEPRLHNDELLAAICSDASRWQTEEVPRPDLIIVSGDLIQGAGPDSSDPDEEIAAQYGEAGNFLQGLANEFLEGDLSRVVIIPGNHDVNWHRASKAMRVMKAVPDELGGKVLEADSGIRWNWKKQEVLEIADAELYESRLQQFRNFTDSFYSGLPLNPLRFGEDLAFFDYPRLGLAVVGFASWHGNDCYCHVGEIERTSLALAQELLRESRAPVAIAVWHHSVVGGPRSHDYMDQRVIHKLIDFGFSVGMHGHQHYPWAAPFELRLPNLTSMVVVGAGSLAVGDRELPMGERRQFNVVEIDSDRESITIHVRAMSPAGVFAGSHRDDFGGNTFVTLPLPLSPARPKPPSATQQLDAAIAAVRRGEFETALKLAKGIAPSDAHPARQIIIEALDGLGRQDDLVDFLTPPQSPDELVRLIALLLELKQYDKAQNQLEGSAEMLDGVLARELAGTIKARRMAP